MKNITVVKDKNTNGLVCCGNNTDIVKIGTGKDKFMFRDLKSEVI